MRDHKQNEIANYVAFSEREKGEGERREGERERKEEKRDQMGARR